MDQLEHNSGNENKRIKTSNTPEILQQMDTWMNEIETNNLENLDNYISTTFALLRDKRLYGNASKYGLSSSEVTDLIPKIEATNNIIKNNNYEIQILQKENIAKLGAIIKGLSNGTFRGGVKHKKRTHKKSSRGRRGKRTRHSRHSKKHKTRHRHSRKKV
jgi:hypothetical protein